MRDAGWPTQQGTYFSVYKKKKAKPRMLRLSTPLVTVAWGLPYEVLLMGPGAPNPYTMLTPRGAKIVVLDMCAA